MAMYFVPKRVIVIVELNVATKCPNSTHIHILCNSIGISGIANCHLVNVTQSHIRIAD